jgi:hypothetical protein
VIVEQVQGPFDRLLDAMPRISEAVNSFTSPDVQKEAFKALIATLGAAPTASPNGSAAPAESSVDPMPGVDMGESAAKTTETVTPNSSAAKARSPRKRTPGSKKVWPVNREINWSEPGKKPLTDLIAEKRPQNFHDKCLVAAYYLVEILGQESFDVPDVLGAFKAMSWRFPSDPANTLQVAASANSWFDTKDMSKVALRHHGINAVEHDLPRAEKGK